MVTASFPLCLTQGVHPTYPCLSVSIRGPCLSNPHGLIILKSRINRLLRKRPPFPLAELAHVLLSKHRVGHTLPLILQKLGVDPWAFLRRRADPLPLLAAFLPLRMKKSPF